MSGSIARRLTDWLAGSRPGAFDWAAANCCHFAAAWVQHATGRDPMAGLPRTATARQALRLVRRLGGSLQAAWTQQLGVQPLPAALAQVGDLVLMPSQAGAVGVGGAVGVCGGASVVLAGDLGGHLWVPLAGGSAAWRLAEVRA